jgi:hypothetical protein
LLFEFGLGFGLFEGEALLFDAKAAGDEVAAAKRDDVSKESANFAQVGFGVFGDGGIVGGGGEAGGDPADEAVHEGGEWGFGSAAG